MTSKLAQVDAAAPGASLSVCPLHVVSPDWWLQSSCDSYTWVSKAHILKKPVVPPFLTWLWKSHSVTSNTFYQLEACYIQRKGNQTLPFVAGASENLQPCFKTTTNSTYSLGTLNPLMVSEFVVMLFLTPYPFLALPLFPQIYFSHFYSPFKIHLRCHLHYNLLQAHIWK